MTQKEMQTFLEAQGVAFSKVEGDDFSSVFHVNEADRNKVEENKGEYEEKTGLAIMTSDNYGMSVVIMENNEE